MKTTSSLAIFIASLLTLAITAQSFAQDLYPEFLYRKAKDSVSWVRAWEKYEQSQYREAFGIIERLPRFYNNDPAALRLKALCALALKEGDVALYWLDRAVAESPESCGLRRDRAEVWNLKQNYRAQAADLAAYLHFVDDDTAAVYNYVKAVRAIDEPDKGIAVLTQFAFKDAELYHLLGTLYLDAGSYESAISAMQDALNAFPGDCDLLAQLAVGYYYTDQLEKALEIANEIISLDESDGYSYALRGWIYEKMNRMFDARLNFDQAEHYGFSVYEDEEEAYDDEE